VSNRRKQRRVPLSKMKIICRRCGRRATKAEIGSPDNAWNVTLRDGAIVAEGFNCPDCQTPEENAEAEIRFDTLDYVRRPDGLIAGRPKVDDDS
jgi:hypothetical protein